MRRLRLSLVCLGLTASAFAGGEVRAGAGDRIIGADGTVHRLSVESWPPDQGPGTAIRYTRQSAAGNVTSMLIKGTDDYPFDREPSLTLSPLTGNPVAVWARFSGVGFDLFASVFENDEWTPPRTILPPNPGRVRPRIKADDALLHVFWTHVDGNASRVARGSFRPDDLGLVLGPEPARVDCAPYAAGDGAEAAGAVGEPPIGDTYFAVEVPGRVQGEPPVLGVWGVRDEPVPIDFRVAFTLPEGARELRSADAAVISGRLAVWFEWSGGLWYSFDDGAGQFTPLRVIKREAGGYPSEALALLRELIDRLPPAP